MVVKPPPASAAVGLWIILVPGQHPFQVGDDRIEGAMLVISGTAVLDAQRGCADDLVLHHLDEAQFANPDLPTQHHSVAPAGLDLGAGKTVVQRSVNHTYRRTRAPSDS